MRANILLVPLTDFWLISQLPDSWHFYCAPTYLCHVFLCYSYQTVTVDYEGKISRDVVHEAARGRWRGAVQLFPSLPSCAFSFYFFFKAITRETCLSPPVYSRLLALISGLWQLDHPFPRLPREHKQTWNQCICLHHQDRWKKRGQIKEKEIEYRCENKWKKSRAS